MIHWQSKIGKNERETLGRLFSSSDGYLKLMAYEVDLNSGRIYDGLKNRTLLSVIDSEVFWVLLTHFSKAKPTETIGKLVKFRNLPGGHAYEFAFRQRAEQPISEAFGAEPELLIDAARAIGGIPLNYGDVSVEIHSLPHILLTYILWKKDEFPASTSILFNESASPYLPTEDLAVLAEITTSRLQESLGSL